MYAIQGGNEAIVTLLLEAGADHSAVTAVCPAGDVGISPCRGHAARCRTSCAVSHLGIQLWTPRCIRLII